MNYITVKPILTKSRQPTEHEIDISGRQGYLLQKVGDGFYLIEFQKKIAIQKGSVKKYRLLQWYVHKDDLIF